MIRSLYLSGTNMIVQRRRMDVITNNIANVETPGYKADRLLSRSFRDMMISRIHDPAVLNIRQELGGLNTGVHIDEVMTSFDQGIPMETQKPTDLMIQGDGFFVVETPDGERYTRDGNFNIDSDGYLVNADGYYVLGTNGRIRVDPRHFNVDLKGNISTAAGYNPGRLRIVNFTNLNGLRKSGNNLYENYSAGVATETTNMEIRQEYLESSNVDAASEIVDMMAMYRSYETSQRIVRMVDESLGKAVNEVGKV